MRLKTQAAPASTANPLGVEFNPVVRRGGLGNFCSTPGKPQPSNCKPLCHAPSPAEAGRAGKPRPSQVVRQPNPGFCASCPFSVVRLSCRPASSAARMPFQSDFPGPAGTLPGSWDWLVPGIPAAFAGPVMRPEIASGRPSPEINGSPKRRTEASGALSSSAAGRSTASGLRDQWALIAGFFKNQSQGAQDPFRILLYSLHSSARFLPAQGKWQWG